ncbi:unnamed protein product [Arctia plantaginis]|uniref:Uncharacterized protein n=1 Tax=Arctia plantaginis TaxID=874455 RepID=A0A8S0ZII6_ARCPL|nr:unnamed protein product [Arctia plantaginis]
MWSVVYHSQQEEAGVRQYDTREHVPCGAWCITCSRRRQGYDSMTLGNTYHVERGVSLAAGGGGVRQYDTREHVPCGAWCITRSRRRQGYDSMTLGNTYHVERGVSLAAGGGRGTTV